MSRIRGSTNRLFICGAVLAALLLAGLVAFLRREEETTSLMSPDQRLRAVLLDHPHFPSIDRNFVVRIERTAGVWRTVFQSPDEPPTGIGAERFLWSKYGGRLLLVGRRFWVREGVELHSGECLYFLHDISSGQTWCNSDRQGPPFGPDELAGYDFGEDLTLTSAVKTH